MLTQYFMLTLKAASVRQVLSYNIGLKKKFVLLKKFSVSVY